MARIENPLTRRQRFTSEIRKTVPALIFAAGALGAGFGIWDSAHNTAQVNAHLHAEGLPHPSNDQVDRANRTIEVFNKRVTVAIEDHSLATLTEVVNDPKNRAEVEIANSTIKQGKFYAEKFHSLKMEGQRDNVDTGLIYLGGAAALVTAVRTKTGRRLFS
jgi:hypothetical protein